MENEVYSWDCVDVSWYATENDRSRRRSIVKTVESSRFLYRVGANKLNILNTKETDKLILWANELGVGLAEKNMWKLDEYGNNPNI